MKNKILAWLEATQKATSGAVGAATAVASATFIPAPYNGYAAVAAIILTWVVAYALPFVQTVVEEFPDMALQPSESPAEPVTQEIPITTLPPVSGEILAPVSEETPQVSVETNGIPVIEGADTGERSYPGPTVDEILKRIAAEQGVA